ncbi:MAG: hypothetical protein R3A48_10160 [Polyangiales bacterium]
MPRSPHRPSLLFADGFGATAVDASGKARSRAVPTGCLGFDAKGGRLAVLGPGGSLTVLTAALREAARGRGPGLLPDEGEALRVTRRGDALGLQRESGEGWCALPEPSPRELVLAPPSGEQDFGFFSFARLAEDGGVAIPLGRNDLLLGALDPEALTVRDAQRVHVAPSPGCERTVLPGREAHVLAARRRAQGELHVLALTKHGDTKRATLRAVSAPARDGDALWVQRDDDSVVCASLDGEILASLGVPAAHRGAGDVFVQHGRLWFVPWHRERVIDLREGREIDRALPGDAALRGHVAEVLRRLRPLARDAGLGLRVASLRVVGGASPTAQMSLWSDGGDLGTLAHCVQGAAFHWPSWAEAPAGQGLASTGGSVTAAREANAAELVEALAALDRHGVPLRASVSHWLTMYAMSATRAFDDETGRLFARVLVHPALRVGEQAECARRAQSESLDFERWERHRGEVSRTAGGALVAKLSRAVMERHTPLGQLPPMDRLVPR